MWIRLVIPPYVLMAALVPVSQMDEMYSESLFHKEGDIIIGIINSASSRVEDLQSRIRPEKFNCSGIDVEGFLRITVSMFTIEEINDSGFLPGVRLGYVAYDVCADATKALLSVEHLLSINGSLPVLHDYSEFRPHVKAIIGEYYSLVTVPIAKLLSVYLFPQISAASSAAVLSDRLWYPSFFRVIPSNVHQTKAMAKLMLHFGWNWVGLVSMDDDYGRGAHQSFLKDAAEDGVCIAYEEVIPHYLGHENSQQRIMEVARQIQQSDAKVVMVILRDELVKMLFEEMIRLKTSRVWIASNIWSSAPLVMDMQDIDKVGDIYGLRFITGNITGFHDFFNNLTVNSGVKNELIEEYKRNTYCSPSPSKDCSKTRAHSLGLTVAYGERVAVWAIAHALRDLLRCNETSCPGETNFPPYQLVEKLRKVKFSFDGEMKFFNEDGDFEDGYEVVMWVSDDRLIKTIGRYNVSTGQMNIDNSDVVWTMTPNNTKPSSQCSESCKSGYFKKMSNISCCYTCLPCGEGTFSSVNDTDECHQCPNGTWSMEGWSKCEARTESYLKWCEPYPITLLVGVIIGVLLLITSFSCFIIKRHTSVIMASNLTMSCFMMLGLLVSFVSVILFMGKPNTSLCRTQQVMYALGFTLCVSCILVKAYRTFLKYMASDPVRHDRLKRLDQPVIIMFLVTLVQCLICIFWMIFDSPDVDNSLIYSHSMVHVVQCTQGTKVGFGVMHSYIALLAFVCFLLAFKGRQVPQDFNETGVISFSMLIHLFVWLCFIPVYITISESRPIAQASAMLVSNYGIIFCLLLPKCHQAIWGKHTTGQMKPRLHALSDFRNRTSVHSDQSSRDEAPTSPPNTDSQTDSGLSMRQDFQTSTSYQSGLQSAEDPVSVVLHQGPTTLDRLGTAVRHRLRSQSM